jgi:pimeloyl-ACP methyl ester carboxylesterase
MPDSVDHLGCPLFFTVCGSGPKVLFIQGVATHGDGWRPQTDALADRFTCLRFDNRGLGRSQPIGLAGIGVPQMADDTRAIVDHLKWDAMHVVGHSLGGLIALQFALENRSRVKSLTLMCTFGRGKDAAPLTLGMMWHGMRSRVGTRKMRRRGFLNLVMPKAELARRNADELAAQLEPLFGHDIGDQPQITGRQLAAMRACDLFPRLSELTGIPTLVMSAAHDRIAPPAAGRKLAEAISGARYEEFADAAHGLPIQCSREVNDRLAEHFG